MACHSDSSPARDVLMETSECNSLQQNTEDEHTELFSELQAGYITSDESRSISRSRMSEPAPPTSRQTSGDETSVEISSKMITENIMSSVVDTYKHEPVHSVGSRLQHSMGTVRASTARTAKSVSSLIYSDDFEPVTTSQTVQSQYTTEYSEDFESISHVVETDIVNCDDVSDMSHSATVSRTETISQSVSTSTSVRDDQSDTTDMTQNDIDDTEYLSEFDRSETQSQSRCSVTYTNSYEQSGVSLSPCSRQDSSGNHVTVANRSTSDEHPSGIHRYLSFSNGSDMKYSYDDDFTQYEEEEEEEEDQAEEEDQGEEEEEEDSEEREAAYQAEVTYVERKLQALRCGPVRRSPLTSHPPSLPHNQRIKNTKHLEDFCCRKLTLLKKKWQQSNVFSGGMESRDHEESTLCRNKGVRHRESARCMYLGLEGTQRVDAHGMSSLKVRKLRERHAMEQIRKAAETKVHIPKKCPACREKLAEMTEEEYFRTKTAKMLARLLEQKVDKHILKYSDTVGLIGELVQELPTLQQTPSEITKQLLQPLESRRSVATETTPSTHLKVNHTLQQDIPQDPTEVWKTYMAPLVNSGWMPAKS